MKIKRMFASIISATVISLSSVTIYGSNIAYADFSSNPVISRECPAYSSSGMASSANDIALNGERGSRVWGGGLVLGMAMGLVRGGGRGRGWRQAGSGHGPGGVGALRRAAPNLVPPPPPNPPPSRGR